MSWIKEIPEGEERGKLKDVYEEIKRRRGKISNVMKAQSLHPEALKAHIDFYMAIMFSRGGLSRAEKELIAVAVSVANGCRYCMEHHLEALRHHLKDDELLKEIKKNPLGAPLPGRLKKMVEYALKLTEVPWELKEADIGELRRAGLTDAEILDVNLITSYFNFVNRVVAGLGVEFDEDEVGGYRY